VFKQNATLAKFAKEKRIILSLLHWHRWQRCESPLISFKIKNIKLTLNYQKH